MGESDHMESATLGAVVTIISAFLAFVPFVGGGVAGYRNERDGFAVGAASGVLAALPLLLIGLAVEGQFGSLRFVGEILSSGVGLGSYGLSTVARQVGLFLLYTVGMSAGGGYVGAMLHNPA